MLQFMTRTPRLLSTGHRAAPLAARAPLPLRNVLRRSAGPSPPLPAPFEPPSISGAQLIDGRRIAKEIKDEVKEEVKRIK